MSLFSPTWKWWNENIIQPINDLSQNPPDGCAPVDTIDELSGPVILKGSHFTLPQNKLVEICSDNEFSDLTPTWWQGMNAPEPPFPIREILDAIANGWCNCCDPDACDPHGTNGQRITVATLTPRVYTNCSGDSEDGGIPLADYISGMNVGPDGIKGRLYTLEVKDTDGGTHPGLSGAIDCHGNIVAGGTTPTDQWGVFVDCADCSSPTCESALSDAATTVASMPHLVLTIIINAGFNAKCDSDCDGTADCDE